MFDKIVGEEKWITINNYKLLNIILLVAGLASFMMMFNINILEWNYGNFYLYLLGMVNILLIIILKYYKWE